VTRPDEIRQLFGRIAREFGKLDILVSNARPELSAFYCSAWTKAASSLDKPCTWMVEGPLWIPCTR
jgi:NAD(P)-dependent dehydrogenase (short-subunit alcohol dehydrogenase family)